MTFPFYGDGDRYHAGGVRRAYQFLGLALLALVHYEWANRQWGVQAGALCGRRLLTLVALAPPWTLALEWGLEILCALALLRGIRRGAAVRLSAALLLWSAQQRYLNQKALLALVFLYIALDPPDPAEPEFGEKQRPNLGLVRWQIGLVYAMSAIQKVRSGFLGGQALAATFALAAAMPVKTCLPSAWGRLDPGTAAALSWGAVLAEAALVPLLAFKPRWGLAGVLLMHGAFALCMPGVLSFSLTMTACAVVCAALRRP